MRIRMLKDRDFTPPNDRRVTFAFRKGEERTVKRAWGEALVAARAAVEIDPPRRPRRAAGEDPFDHDGDGRPGGSLPKAKRHARRG